MADDIARNYAEQVAQLRQERRAAEQREQLKVIEDTIEPPWSGATKPQKRAI